MRILGCQPIRRPRLPRDQFLALIFLLAVKFGVDIYPYRPSNMLKYRIILYIFCVKIGVFYFKSCRWLNLILNYLFTYHDQSFPWRNG